MALKRGRLREVRNYNAFGRVLEELMRDRGIVNDDGTANHTELGRLLVAEGLVAQNGRQAVDNATLHGTITGSFIACTIAALELDSEDTDRLFRAAQIVWDEDRRKRLQQKNENSGH